MAINRDIEKALKKIKGAADRYKKNEDYYEGEHDLKFASEKFTNAFGKLFKEFSLNLCPAVVDALRDKLVITSFNIEKGAGDNLPKEAWRIWQANRMNKRAGQIHKEAIKNGDAYAIVWPDAKGKATIFPNKARTCVVEYDEETPGKIMWAAKLWPTSDKKFRLNLFYADRIEKYITNKAQSEQQANTFPEAKEFEPLQIEGDDNGAVVPNPYGIVPVFHFANNADLGSDGRSELKDARPVQDALNKTVLDMMVAMEFQSYRQRYATGIEIEYDDQGKPIPPFTSGSNHLWVSENPDAEFGDFEVADLKQFLEVKEGFRVDMACVTGTPMWYLTQGKGDFPSGEALKKAESRFVKKVTDRQISFGQTWEDVMAFALTIEKKGGAGVQLFVAWEDAAPIGEKEKLENILLKKDIGVTDRQALIEAGYGEEDVEKMLLEKKAARKELIDSFNAGDEEEGNLQE